MTTDKEQILSEMDKSLQYDLLQKWYPLSIDKTFGGYYTNLTHDLKLMEEHEKMLVTQARHVWATSKASKFFNNEDYKIFAFHGYEFLKDHMLDSEYSGFYQMRSREGGECDAQGFYSEKRAYGNAFAIYGLAALYETTKDENVLNLAIENFNWLEKFAFDPEHKGYFQFFTREGNLIHKNGEYRTNAFDEVESDYKDQNTSIHILEAYTELYHVWKDDKLAHQLKSILELIRDKMVSNEGYLRLFFEYDWTPVSFRNSPGEIRESSYRLDHVSFGHDYETAFLMLEASYTLGLKDDVQTLQTAKKMIDHAIANGWDEISGGFYEEGYYFSGENKCAIINDAKNWWSQAEGLNALLLFSKIFPDETKYFDLFTKLWDYIKKFVIDSENGDWYWGGIDKEPFHRTTPKGSIWKGTYHNCRGLMNCIMMLDIKNEYMTNNDSYKQLKNNFDNMTKHWRVLAENI